MPACGICADPRQVIDHHNAGEVHNVRIEITCQDTCQVPATNSSCTGLQDILQMPASSETCTVQCPRGKLLGCHSNNYPIYTLCRLPPSSYPVGDPPVLNGTPNEPYCPHCLFGSCIIRRPPVFLIGKAVPSWANGRKQYKIYQRFWKLLKDLGLWDHPTYLARMTHPLDRRKIMPKCVQNVNDPTFLLENVLIISLLHRKSEAGIQIPWAFLTQTIDHHFYNKLFSIVCADQYL